MNTKLKCLLLDDELLGLTYLKMLCEQIPELEVVKAFNSPEVFLSEIAHLEFDICILDIEMPGMNGLQIANLLNGKPVIFTTAYKDYAAEAFDLNAIDYVQKPIKKERLHQAIQKAQLRFSTTSTEKHYIQLNTNKGKAIIFFDQLAYIKTSEIDSRDKIAYMLDGSELTLKNISFEKLIQLIPQSDFARVNKQELVALRIIQVFSFDEITTTFISKTGKNIKLSLSEIYRKEFLEKIKV